MYVPSCICETSALVLFYDRVREQGRCWSDPTGFNLIALRAHRPSFEARTRYYSGSRTWPRLTGFESEIRKAIGGGLRRTPADGFFRVSRP